MYEDTGWRLYELTIEALRQAIHVLNLQPGPGGSGMTDSQETINALRPIIVDDFDWTDEENDDLSRPWLNARIVGLWPGQQIPAHVDAPLAPGVVRHHVPLALNPGCWVFHDGHWKQLTVGGVYTVDPTKVHGAVNWGETVRLHLLVDLVP